MDVTIEADEELLAQAWTNILRNAIKFMPPGGQIAVSCRAGAGSAASGGLGMGSVFEASLPLVNPGARNS